MGQTLTSALCLLFTFAAAARGLASLAKLSKTASALVTLWTEEYQLRRCAQLAAASANIDAAQEYLTARNPALQVPLAHAAGDLDAALKAGYPASPRTDAAGPCRMKGRLGLAASLRLQTSPGQPASWPNWVAVLEWSDGGQRGAVTMAITMLMASALLLGLLYQSATLIKGMNSAWRLFDDERNSLLYCQEDIDDLALHGPTRVSHAPKSAESVICIPKRYDYAAPGAGEGLPRPICALMRRVGETCASH